MSLSQASTVETNLELFFLRTVIPVFFGRLNLYYNLLPKEISLEFIKIHCHVQCSFDCAVCPFCFLAFGVHV